MEILGYTASIVIGISLGLIGGGGSILTVPVLIYVFAIDAVLATAYSIFIVGATSLVGSFSYFKKGLISLNMVGYFGVPSMIAVFLTRHYILPAIPEHVFTIQDLAIGKHHLLLFFFATLMILASYSMIKPQKKFDTTDANPTNDNKIILQGLIVGFITGLIGAGGGFLIIPALVKFVRLPIKVAIGTSLLIIALNSLTGFAFSLSENNIQWPFLLKVTCTALVGIFIGSYLSTKIDGKKLKPVFGWFILAMGVYLILKESILK